LAEKEPVQKRTIDLARKVVPLERKDADLDRGH
jgi:hypothetical protein